MEIYRGNVLYLNHRVFICLFAVIVSLIMAVSGDRSTDTGYNNEDVATQDFKTLWDIYLLPRLQLDLNRKASEWLDEHLNNAESSNYDYINDQLKANENDQGASRFKRLGVAGLENLDMMTKTLAQNRLPMSVNMNTNRLRMLMRTVGRRRK
ncbi:uncharacterized protein LOC132722671 [Ruditapes philippinarum]|uniref:uncharacterized protein LOC132722671 n=1 Tax=Ruditapes philippinarum TaxID=129788 RepID=UPI00295B40D2|nr:uncharacterized protein LOC132722671 [Ruditapes philippinarum]XP_060563173.1 uncharacterized protein LOC132722671 [Ruditapes philippinarum]XP_060563174.1 uncharacterized protein LOC132722671 [Ruditapes philippinarum]XP_060563175.1 uncharacterized protein LOC132722671 [Ruditapes philippinarum]